MAQRTLPHGRGFVVEHDQALIAIPIEENGREAVRYLVEEEPVSTTTLPNTVQDALSLAGAWSDLDWDATVEALDRIRHESTPTPIIDV
jgi:hypothetical protein